MAFKFIVKGTRNPSKFNVRYTEKYGETYLDFTSKTEIEVDPTKWSGSSWKRNSKNYQPKDAIDERLSELTKYLKGALMDAREKRKMLDSNWLKSCVHQYHNPELGKDENDYSSLLTDQLDRYGAIVCVNKGVSEGTMRNYRTTKSRIVKFQNRKNGRQYYLIDLDINFLEEYNSFARDTLGLQPNSIGKDIRNIKAVCNNALERDLGVNSKVFTRSFTVKKELSSFVTLSIKEIEIIKQFQGKDTYNRIRDFLIIGCWTGCRYGDLINLTMKNIHVKPNGTKVLVHGASKVHKQLEVQLHPDVIEVLDKNDGFPKPMTLEKFNVYVKEFAKEIGLDEEIAVYKTDGNGKKVYVHTKPKYELIASHIMRRSMASNHYGHLPNDQIMLATGHSTEKQLLEYIDKTHAPTNEESYSNAWDLMNKGKEFQNKSLSA